jgi:hypothetical protein
MAEVKGTAVGVTGEYVRVKYGEGGHRRWLESLSPRSRAIFSSAVFSNVWFPLEPAFIEPTQRVCDLFHAGRPIGAVEIGRFSAERAVRGIYKFFVRLGSPEWLIERASSVFATYYRPCQMCSVPLARQRVARRISGFPDMHRLIEARIEGWIARAMEISGCGEVHVRTATSLTEGAACTELQVSWS